MNLYRAGLLLLYASLVVAVTGCMSGSPIMQMGQSNSFNLAPGNWQVTASSALTNNATTLMGGYLNQSGNNIAGAFHVFDLQCFDPTTDVVLNGSVAGEKATIVSSAAGGQTISFTVSAASPSALTGSYAITGGCAAGEKGSLTAVLVPSITGSWKGTLASTSGAAVRVSAVLTQTAADAHGLFHVSGNLTFTGSPCFTSASVDSGFLAGEVAGISATADDGSTLNFTANLGDPSSANSFAGQYTIAGGSCAGDHGSGSLVKQ